jgi:hypothetical protein
MGWAAGVWFPAGARKFPLLHTVQTGSGTNPASYPMGTVGGGGGEADHSAPCSAEAKNCGAIPPVPHGVILN